jgi:pimeloyl-ACP methyl ester carboxylesterase
MKQGVLVPLLFSLLLFLFILIGNSCKKESTEENNNGQVQYANITSAKIAYKVYGSGDPLIMCIGYGTNMDLWSTGLIDILKEKYKVIIFDYRGMGLSTNSDSTLSINSMAEDLNELMGMLNINKSHLLGWSMGGFVAQKFAINHPEKVNKLILYATNYGDTLTVEPTQEIVNILDDPSASDSLRLTTLFPDDWLEMHPEPWKFLPDATEPYNGETIGMQYMAIQEWLSPGGGSSAQLGTLNMPVLIICGDQDKVVPCINSSMIKELIPASTLVKIPDCGHGAMYQIPDDFGNHVKDFLEP